MKITASDVEVKVLKNEPEYAELIIKNSEPGIMNALRRIILGEVPVMAVDEVIIYENTSPLPDEYLAHRMAFVPMKTDLKNYKKPSDCCGGNCSSCSVTLNIDESGPKTVYSSSIETTDPKVKPVSGKIPVAELTEGQRLRMEAKAVLGQGENHVKWQPGNASYKFMPVLKTKGKLENPEKIASVCPQKVLKAEKGKLVLEKPEGCTMCMACVEAGKGKVEIKQERTSFVFKVETNGQITALEAIQKAFEILHQKNKSLKKEVGGKSKK
jgi:DNA-directed RNA polymerase subunit D